MKIDGTKWKTKKEKKKKEIGKKQINYNQHYLITVIL